MKPEERDWSLPSSLHWLGDRESADQSGHAADVRGCVMYFKTQGECIQFMNWLASLSDDEPVSK